MLNEQECPVDKRYLCSIFFLSDKAISLWKKNTIEKANRKSLEHQRYMHWTRGENEIAVFSLYAYADLDLNKKFDVVFDIDHPENFVQTSFRIKQSIFNGWFAIDTISHGHKHLLVLEFDNEVPNLIYKLYEADALEVVLPEKYLRLGLCSLESFEQIRLNRISF